MTLPECPSWTLTRYGDFPRETQQQVERVTQFHWLLPHLGDLLYQSLFIDIIEHSLRTAHQHTLSFVREHVARLFGAEEVADDGGNRLRSSSQFSFSSQSVSDPGELIQARWSKEVNMYLGQVQDVDIVALLAARCVTIAVTSDRRVESKGSLTKRLVCPTNRMNDIA